MKTRQLQPPPSVQERERGSALLVVFLFAATIAIFLYAELPIVVMEAQRQKEQTLMDHAAQYQRAIQVYFRKSHTYPPTIDALENTNNMRFLRRRYTDPMTGKDDWRILHMGPAGVTDSLVNPLAAAGLPGQTGQSGFGQNASGQDGFGSSGFGQATNTAASSNSTQLQANDPNATVDPNQAGQNGDSGIAQANRRRRPPTAVAGANGPQDPNAPEPQSEPVSSEPTQGGDTTALGVPNATGQQPAGGGQNGQVNPNGNPNGPGAPNANATLANQIMRNPATSPAAPTGATQQQTGTSSGNPNPIIGGSIAGVASKVHGRAIKVYNDQTDYAKWEFIYDFRKDTGMTAGNNPQGNIPLQNGAPGMNTSGQSGSSFGQSGSSFGQSTNQNTANQNSPPASSNTNPTPNQ